MRSLLLLVSLFAFGCSSVQTDDIAAAYDIEQREPLRTMEDYQAYLARISAAMDRAVGEARAERPAQCEAIAYGEKACGGHSTSRVFSTADGDPEGLRQLADLFTRVQHDMNERLGLMSDCMLEPVARPALQDGRCVADGVQQ